MRERWCSVIAVGWCGSVRVLTVRGLFEAGAV